MKTASREMASRVWSRVQPVSMEERQSLGRLAVQLEGDIRYLKTQAGTSHLVEALQGQLACLRGIHTVAAGNPMKTMAKDPTAGLKQCYFNAMDRQREYLLRSADPQFGPVYTSLARDAVEQGKELLRLLGGG